MSTVFISYERSDSGTVDRLERALSASRIVAKRDQIVLHEEGSWARSLGEVIARSDAVLLLWSRSSSGSHVVELEWMTTVALGKSLLPCVLDRTPLPPALSALATIDLKDFERGMARILKSLEHIQDRTDPRRYAAVLETLHEAHGSSTDDVARSATLLLSRHLPGGRAVSSVPAAAAEIGIGALIAGRYRIERILGEGGMGNVYLVEDRELERRVALKVIRPELARNALVIERFKREIQLSSTVTHKNVLRVYDLGESGGVKFLTMQYVEGEDLGSLL